MAKYRYENKYIIDPITAQLLKKQLAPLMQLDPHSQNSDVSYYIRSLYFDNLDHDAYFEKIDGIEYRKKYRMRMYNGDTSMIKMECKYKDENMTSKQSAKLTMKSAEEIIDRKYHLVKTTDPFLQQFLLDAKLNYLVPTVIVDYTRLVYVYPYSDVRITFDSDLKTTTNVHDFLNIKEGRIGCFNDGNMVLEVKYNEMLPDHIQAVLNQYQLTLCAISKFATCCEYQ